VLSLLRVVVSAPRVLASGPGLWSGCKAIVFAAVFASNISLLQACDTLPELSSRNGSWQDLSAQAEKYQQKGSLQEAENIWQRALRVSESAGGDVTQLNRTLHSLAQLEFCLGNYQRAKELYLRLVEIKKREQSALHGSLAWNLSELGDACYWLGDYKQALEYYSQSAEIYEQDGQLIGLASSLRKKAGASARLNDDMEAISLYNRAEMFVAAAKSNPAFEAYSYMLLDQLAQISAERVELCRKTHHYDLAMQYTVEADERWKKLAEFCTVPARPPVPSGRLAEILSGAARKTKDQSTLFEAAAPTLVKTLETLAYDYCHAGMYGEAELLFGRIMEIFNTVAEFNRVLQLDRGEFVSTLYMEWHVCHQALPKVAEALSSSSDKAKQGNVDTAEYAFDNQYLTEFRALKHRQDRFEERARLVQRFAPAIPTHHAIEILRKHQPLIVIGDGVDYWMSILRKLKVDAIAAEVKLKVSAGGSATAVANERRSSAVKTVMKNSDRVLFICCPPAGSSIAFDALSNYAGSTVIYVGEPAGLSGVDESFFKLLSKRWNLKSLTPLPQWPEAYDVMFEYERKPTKG
jgi:tetratricopeptide (TPR) repeat protein